MTSLYKVTVSYFDHNDDRQKMVIITEALSIEEAKAKAEEFIGKKFLDEVLVVEKSNEILV